MKRLFFIWVLLLGTTAVMGQKTFSTDEVHAFATLAEGADFKALEAYTKELEAENDSLQFELSDLKLYNEYLEKTLDSLEYQR